MESRPVSRVTLLNITIFVEALLLLLATAWSQFARVELAGHMTLSARDILLGCLSGSAMALTGTVIFWLGKSIGLLSQLRDIIYNYLIPLLCDLKWTDLFLLAAVSGFCEEIFFRGVVQAQFGIWACSIAFGFFHDPSFKHVSYSIMAFLAGLALGALYLYTNNLWAPITAHVVHNLISLYILRYIIKPPAIPSGEGEGEGDSN